MPRPATRTTTLPAETAQAIEKRALQRLRERLTPQERLAPTHKEAA